MWQEKDALNAVKLYFQKDESYLLNCRPHRFLGVSLTYQLIFLVYCLLILAVCLRPQIGKPLYWLLIAGLTLVLFRKFLHHCVFRNDIIMTQFALYRHICASESRIMQTNWSDVAEIFVKKSRLFPSISLVCIRCDKKKMPRRNLIPKKLFKMRFGKMKMARIQLIQTHSRPYKQCFALKDCKEFISRIREVQMLEEYSFVISTKGKRYDRI